MYENTGGSSLTELPQVMAGEHIIEALFQIGPVKAEGMGGYVAISETELAAWQFNQGIRLDHWECRLIRQLSKEYAHTLMDAKDPNMAPPFVAGVDADETQRAIVTNKFKALAARRKKR